MVNEEDRQCEEAPQPLSEHSDRPERVAELPKITLQAKGVFRFRTFEEFNKWKKQFTVKRAPKILHK
jgi:hypothetical protein